MSRSRRSNLGLALVAVALWGGAGAVGCGSARGELEDGSRPELALYAAASLRDALETLEASCERETGVDLTFNFGASNDLARQILAANRADLFVSADEDWMDAVAVAGLVDAASRRSLLSNRLVVVGPWDSRLRIVAAADLASPEIRRLSLADPDAVPAGRYAKAWLERAGLWEAVAQRVVPALDVRAALAAVESGAIEAGIVYATDAAISARVRALLEVPEHEAPLIRYPIAALAGRPRLELARRVVEWLAGAQAGAVFESYGFGLLAAGPEPARER